MLQKIIRSFYPDIHDHESRKFRILALISSLIIGAYWLLRLLKNTIFIKIAFPEQLGWKAKQGILFQPTAKIWSFVVMFGIVLIYSALVDRFKKQQLFYILCTFYAFFFAAIGVVILLNDIYGPTVVGRVPLAITGWASYFIVESFGSLVVALFWSFTNSINDPESAKRGFPFIIMVSHIGATFFSSILLFSKHIGLWPILFGTSLVVLCIIPLVHYFMKTIPQEALTGYEAAIKTKRKKEGTLKGIVSGFVLLLTRPYLMSIFIVTTFHQGISQIVEYQMQTLADVSLGTDDFSQFQAIFGMSINIISFFIALLGTRYLFKRFGIRRSIMLFPVLFGVVLTAILLYSLSSPSALHLLWTTFAVMIMVKGIGYAVNNPTKEVMYIPTSKDANFKTKSFIETVGARGAKAGGATINQIFKHSLSDVMVYGSLIGLGLIMVWGAAATFAGKKYTNLVKNNEVVD